MLEEGNISQSLDESGLNGLDHSGLSENTTVLKYSLSLMEELNQLKKAKRLFDTILIDCSDNSFSFPCEILIEAASLAKDLLNVQGSLVFIASDKATAIIKESGLGQISMQVFHSFSEVYDYSPSLIKDIERVLGTNSQITQGNTSLSEQILLSSIPVLTFFGIKLKANMDSSKNRNMLLAAVDNYTPLSTIIQRLSTSILFEEALDEVRALDEVGAIYPIFSKIPFLVHCFRNQIAFDLKNYLVETNLVNKDRLEELIIAEQNPGNRRHFSLGTLCVANDLISSRQLEIALQDISYYGQPGGTVSNKVAVRQQEESKVKSLVGYLGNTDPSALLQSLANSRETGVLSVEHQSLHFRAIFSQGKLTHCNQGKLKGDEAAIEFVSTWKQGVFVFIERQPPVELATDTYKTTLALERLLLDAALASDNMEAVWKKLPKGINTILERVEDKDNILKNNKLSDPHDNTPLNAHDLETIAFLHQEFDGLNSIASTVKRFCHISTYKIALGVRRLLAFKLVKVPETDLYNQIHQFQLLVKQVENKVGLEQNIVFLRLSLQASQGYSTKVRIFTLGSSGEIGFDLSFARQAHFCLQDTMQLLRDWQDKYMEYITNELDKETLEKIRVSVLQSANSP